MQWPAVAEFSQRNADIGVDILEIAHQLRPADALQAPADQAQEGRVGFRDHNVRAPCPECYAESSDEETHVVDQPAEQRLLGELRMPNPNDANALVHFGTVRPGFAVVWAMGGLANDDGDIEQRRQILAEFRQELARCLRVGPIGAVQEEDVQ